ncbi:MAG: hypothetical protein Q8932_04725 [Bacteroidota bacterium]|nr:hypothetical protein [Bacteroidota bacterium]MDP4245131.1 hypothetical protein [Bacteroidota bacterium]MDP4253349.1 hypothetical protein [Bacteroidota bacterium]MDP4256792.1 hypothetical protein [Bacteroidota bacterium]
MLYIHLTACISPQSSFPEASLDHLQRSADNKLRVIEPLYEGLPQQALRRMAKVVRIGAGAALPLIRQAGASCLPIDGIIIGTGNAGMEQSIQFVQQIVDHAEGILSPGDFVQSTPNIVGSQISALTKNKKYNITHVHGGLAFENALLDAAMQVMEHPTHTYLLGGVDEIGTYNYNIDFLEGWYKKEALSNHQLYERGTPGSLVGEGAAMFLVNQQEQGALAGIRGVATLHADDPAPVAERLGWFLDNHLAEGEQIELFLSGENGDSRLSPFYEACEEILAAELPIARFKHMSGEYPTASAFALWLASIWPGGADLPGHMLKRGALPLPGGETSEPGIKMGRNVLIYNTYKGMQHSFMLLSRSFH